MADCTVIYYETFKDKIRVQRELKSEMIRRFGFDKDGKENFRLNTLDNCVMAIHRSERKYF